MKGLFKRFKCRRRVYCLVCDKTAPSGPPEPVLAWLNRHRCLGGHSASCGLASARDDWCPDCKRSFRHCSVQQLLETGRSPSALKPGSWPERVRPRQNVHGQSLTLPVG